MQAESAYLSVPMADTAMFAPSDDEMIDDDDRSQRADEDIIDIDEIETYNIPTVGDSAADEDMIGLDDQPDIQSFGENDNDELMLDEADIGQETTGTYEVETVDVDDSVHDVDYDPALAGSTVTLVGDEHASPTEVQPASPTALDEGTTAVEQSTEPTEPEQAQRPVEELELFEREAQPVEVPATAHLDPAEHPADSVNDEVASNHSSVTLSENHVPPDDSAQETPADPESRTEDQAQAHGERDSTADTEGSDYTYPHPVIVSYDGLEVSLFPPLSEDSASSAVYKGVPEEFFLQDDTLCDRSFDELFYHLRDILRDAVTEGQQLFIDVDLLGLTIGEDDPFCKSMYLRQLLDCHCQLHLRDGFEVPVPFRMSLYMKERLSTRVGLVQAIVHEGKGLEACLHALRVSSTAEHDEHEVVEAASVPTSSDHQQDDVEDEGAEDGATNGPEHYAQGIRNTEQSEVESDTNYGQTLAEHEDSKSAPSKAPVQPSPPTTYEVVHEDDGDDEIIEYEDEQDTKPVNIEPGDAVEGTPSSNEDGNQSAADDEEVIQEPHGEASNENEEQANGEGPLSPVNKDTASQNESEEPSPIPVFEGDDNAHPGEYDNHEQNYEQYHPYGEETENCDENQDSYQEDNTDRYYEDVEGITEHYPTQPEGGSFQDGAYEVVDEHHDFSADFNYPGGDDAGPYEGTAEEDGSYEHDATYEEHVDLPATEAVDATPAAPNDEQHSPADTEDEEELIEYEEETAPELPTLHKSSSSHSLAPQKRAREDEADLHGDGEVDDNQGWFLDFGRRWLEHDNNIGPPAAKRARAD